MPSIPDIEARCEMFVQKANHVVTCLEDIANLFYGDDLKSKWVSNLRKIAGQRYGKESPLAAFIESISPFLLFVINARNLVEHQKPDRRIDIQDFSINEAGQIIAPSIEVMHPETPLQRTSASEFMDQITRGLVTTFETMMAHLCNANIKPLAGMPIYVSEIPANLRTNQNVRYGYVANIGGQIARFG